MEFVGWGKSGYGGAEQRYCFKVNRANSIMDKLWDSFKAKKTGHEIG